MATMPLLSSTSTTFAFLHPIRSALPNSSRSPCSRLSFSPCKTLQAVSGARRRLPRLQQHVVTLAMQDGQQTTDQGQQAPFSIMNLPDWAKWLLGGLSWLIIPAFRRLQKVGDTVDKVDAVVEKIEEYADRVDKIAEEIAEELPEGRLKDFVEKVEDASELISDKAEKLDDVLDKVADVIDEFEEDQEKKESGEQEKEKLK